MDDHAYSCMESHVEHVSSQCQEYVIGGSDREPVKILAKGIRSGQYDLHKLVVALGPYLTSTDEATRSRSTRLLSEVLGQLPEYKLTDGEVQHLVTFYCDRLKDKVSVIPQVLLGLQVMITYQSLTRDQVIQISQAIFKELYVQSLPAMDRKMVFMILSSFLTCHMEAMKTVGADFVFGYIQAIDGEKSIAVILQDPRNLLIIFKSSLLVIHYLPIDNFVEDMFEVSSCYFPIDFTPPPNDPHHIKRDDLVLALRGVLCATPLFAELCIPLLMEKLSSDVISAKVDSLLTLAASTETYRQAMQGQLEQLWSSISREVYQSVNEAVEGACHEAVKSITRSLSTVVTKSGNGLHKWMGLILQDTQRHLSDIKLLSLTTDLLYCVAEGSELACHQIMEVVIPLLLKQYKSHHQVSEKIPVLESLLKFLRVSQCLFPASDTTGDTVTIPLVTHRDDILALLLSSAADAHSSLRAAAITGLVGLLSLTGLLSSDQVTLCGDHMIQLALCDLEDKLRKESSLALAFVSEHYPMVFKDSMLPSLLDKIRNDQMEVDDDDHLDNHLDRVDQSRLLHVLCVVSGNHKIASFTLPWLLDHLKSLSTSAYNEETLAVTVRVVECARMIAEHLSVLCDDSDNVDYFKVFLSDLLTLFIDPTLDGEHIIDPHVLTDGTVLGHVATLLRVCIQGTSSKMKVFMIKVTKRTMWTLIGTSSDTPSFNPFDPHSPWQQTQLVSLLTATLSSFETTDVVKYLNQQMVTLRNLACHTHHQPTCVHASKLYASIINKLPEGDDMTYCINSDLDYVWTSCMEDDMSDKIKAVTWWIWVTKALVIRSHPLRKTATMKLLSTFTTSESVAKVASDGLYIILNDVPDVLNSKCNAIVKLMYRQQFFVETLPVLVEQLNDTQNAHKQYYLRALSHVMQAVPKQVLLGELPSLLPLLIGSLQCPNEGLQVSTLDGVYALVFDAPDVMGVHVPTLLPKLLHLAQHSSAMRVRIPALQCLGSLTTLPVHQVYPYKNEVIQGLESCLDDNKRLVRKEAVKSRSSWFLLGAT